VAQLIVNDGYVNSEPSAIQIQVISRQSEAIDKTRDIETAIASLDPAVVKNMKNALINKLNAVIASINAGLYRDALDQLQNDILGKTDGCAKTGAPDKNDWITTCQDQEKVYPLIFDLIRLIQDME
jgi:hypothetical protein